MRLFIITALTLALPTIAQAQGDSPLGLRHSRGLQVAVIDADSREWQGRLLEVGADAVVLEIGSDARRFALTEIKRVDARGDKVWDGAVKGAIFGALVGLAVGAGRFAAQSSISYALIGLGLDAMNSCTHTVYRARPVGVTVSW